MNKSKLILILTPVALLVLLLVARLFLFTVDEREQVIITQFGKPVGEPITSAGLHFKMPFVQDINRMDKRVMEWDGTPDVIPTKDKLFVHVDTYARWSIENPLIFFQSLREMDRAYSRLDDILDGETRNAVAKHTLIELVRTDKTRRPEIDESMTTAGVSMTVEWQPIRYGRDAIADEILKAARPKLKSVGIYLLDIRFKRIKYNDEVQDKIFERMISERQQIAEKFRSEGQGQAARILGEKERELRRIESEAYRKTQEIQGEAEAKAIDIYASAYNQSPEAYQFYQFQKTMETYRTTLDRGTTMILSTEGDYFKFFKNIDDDGGNGIAAPASGTTATTGTLQP